MKKKNNHSFSLSRAAAARTMRLANRVKELDDPHLTPVEIVEHIETTEDLILHGLLDPRAALDQLMVPALAAVRTPSHAFDAILRMRDAVFRLALKGEIFADTPANNLLFETLGTALDRLRDAPEKAAQANEIADELAALLKPESGHAAALTARLLAPIPGTAKRHLVHVKNNVATKLLH